MNRELIERLELALNFDFDGKSMHRLLKDCKEALELPKQEPVAYVPMTYSERMNWLKDSGYEANTAILLEYEKEIIQRANLIVKDKP